MQHVKLATMFFVVVSLFSLPLLAQEPTPVTQDPKPVVISEEQAVDTCSINSEISLTVHARHFALRYAPEAKPSKKGKEAPARDSKVQTISVRTAEACGGGTVIEWSRTSQKGRCVETRLFKITSIGGIAGIAVPTAEIIITTNLMLNAEPVPVTREVQLKKVQGRLLLSVVERLEQVCHERANYTQAQRDEKPLRLDPILAKDVIAIFSAAQGNFYTTLVKKEKKAKAEEAKPEMPKVEPQKPGELQPK